MAEYSKQLRFHLYVRLKEKMDEFITDLENDGYFVGTGELSDYMTDSAMAVYLCTQSAADDIKEEEKEA